MTENLASTTSGKSDDISLSPLFCAACTFDDLVGSEADFYGAIVDERLFKLNEACWEVLEESTAYGSQLDDIASCNVAGLFPDKPLARVRLVTRDDGFNDTYELIGIENGHTWLRFGTKDYYDDEPEFIFEYTPLEVPQ